MSVCVCVYVYVCVIVCEGTIQDRWGVPLAEEGGEYE